MFPIVYVPPLQSGDLNSKIDRLQKCVDSSVRYKQIIELRRCHELAHHYVMGQVEDPVSVDFSPKLGHCLTLILRDVSKSHSPDAAIQVQLFDRYAALSDCVKPGNFIVLIGVRVDISMMCAQNQRISHSELQISAKPLYQKNFQMFFMPDSVPINLPLEEIKLKITSISACKLMKDSVEKIYVNVTGVITARTPFKKVNAKEWTCFIIMADQTVHCEHLYECCSSSSSLLIQVVSSACLNAFEKGDILRISHLQIIEKYDVIIGLMQIDCQSGIFHVTPDDMISVLPLHPATIIQSSEWHKVKEIFCWWTSQGIQKNNSDVLPSYLISKGFMIKRPDVLAEAEAASVQDNDVNGKPELFLSRVQNPRKRKVPEHYNTGEKKVDGSKGRTRTNSPLKCIRDIVSSYHVTATSSVIIHKSTKHSCLSHVDNNVISQFSSMLHMPKSPKELKQMDVEVPICPEDRLKNMESLKKLDKLNCDMCFDIDCQVVGFYCVESFDQVVLKVWDGSKCPYINNKSHFSVDSLTTKFEDPNLADIEDYCVNVNVFGVHMMHAEIIELYDIVRLRNVHCHAGILNIPGWYHKDRGISIYRTNAFRNNLESYLNSIRMKLRKEEENSASRSHCPATNMQSGMLNVLSTDSLANANILPTSDAFTPFETIKQNMISKKSPGDVTVMPDSVIPLHNVAKGVEQPTSALFAHTSKPQNKRLQSSFSMVGHEDVFFDIFCQVVGCYQNDQPLKIILKVWDGTKCQSDKCKTHYDSWTSVFEDPHLDDIDEYCVCVNIYDQYMELARKLQLSDIVKLCNIRARSGVFSMHGGRIKERKILICSLKSAIAKSLAADLTALREILSKNKKIDASDGHSQNVIKPLNSAQENIAESAETVQHCSSATNTTVVEIPTINKEKFFPNAVCAKPVKECQARPSSVARIKRSTKPGKFCFSGAVLDINPRANNVAELVKWFCVCCENTFSSEDLKGFKALGHYKYQCPCNVGQSETSGKTVTVHVLEPIFVLRLTLCDLKYERLKVIVYGPQADTFFRNYSAIDFLENEYVRERFTTLLQSLCNPPGCLTKSSFALHCQICSSSAKNGNTVYSIVHTQLIPFHEITRINS